MALDVATRRWTNKEVRPKYPERAVKLPVAFVASQALIAAGTRLGMVTASGLFAPYVHSNSDGTQQWKAVLPVDISVDASGNITLTDTSGQVGGEFGEQMLTYPVWFTGDFDMADLDGLDANSLADRPGAIILKGTIAASNAVVHLP